MLSYRALCIAASLISVACSSSTVTRCPLGDEICLIVAKHCDDIYFELERQRKFAFKAKLGDSEVSLSAEYGKAISEQYIALRGMAYFSCAAYNRGDISHKEYVESLFPIAALAESISKYLGNTRGAEQIREIVKTASQAGPPVKLEITYIEIYNVKELRRFRATLSGREEGDGEAVDVAFDPEALSEATIATLDHFFLKPDVSSSSEIFRRLEYERIRTQVTGTPYGSSDGAFDPLLINAIDARLRRFEIREGVPQVGGAATVAPNSEIATRLSEIVASRFVEPNRPPNGSLSLRFSLAEEDRAWVDSVCTRFAPFGYSVLGVLYVGFSEKAQITLAYLDDFRDMFSSCGFEIVTWRYAAPTRDPSFVNLGDGGAPAKEVGISIFIIPELPNISNPSEQP